MADHQAAIQKAIEDPSCIYRSKSDPDNRHVYFRQDGHPDFPDFFLTVVVERAPEPSGVITAFPQPSLRGVAEGGLLYVRPRR